MKNCTSYKKLFSEYVDKTLEPARSRDLEAHTASCAACKSSLDAMLSIKRSLASLPKIGASDSFDAVMRARLRQQIRREGYRTRSLWRLPSFSLNFKAPAYAVLAVLLIFLGAMLQKTYNSGPQVVKGNYQFSQVQQALLQKAGAIDPGYMVIAQRDSVNNRIVIINYVDIDEIAPLDDSLQKRTQGLIYSKTGLPNLREAPSRQIRTSALQSNPAEPRIQYAKEYIF